MSRSEKLILVRDLPSSIVTALDAIFEAQGYERVAARTISEDFSPILHEPEGPLAFVLSPSRGDWVACFSSLAPDTEAEVARALAAGLEQPVLYVIFGGASGVNMYQYFEQGDLHEEALADGGEGTALDEAALLEKLRTHGVDETLVDDRTAGFGDEHLVIGYTLLSGTVEHFA